ncbi:PREDICTED: protein disulfide-isomerase A5 isoform X1 [Papilio xuthus]|uniref:Protein disulfide-isomerase A5 isoform X1 n=1 Tax=Papilio xuthus TaxID=66420 RepID=A0AAJ7EJ09_PAPXU|nr:PREDICTED: protein disulfide-isomerase A5 isoform X1 [Papilio xuthus]
MNCSFHKYLLQLFIYLCLCMQTLVQAKKQKTNLITQTNDIKEFKKLLRTKTNVLVLFVNEPKTSQAIVDVFKETADAMKGKATLVSIDCSNSDGKKLCKKLKVSNEKPYHIKHYKDGEYHKDYDRGETVSAFCNFLRDPTGDLPWEEDPKATDIFHLQDGEALTKFLKKGMASYKRSLIMFYAPWCGYCKTLKPEYVAAAADLKGEALLAAIDVAKPGNSRIRQQYNITGFPTLLYYEKGQFRFPYNGDNKHQAIVDFMRDPHSQVHQKKSEVDDESWSQDSDVVHLTADSFDSVLANVEHALVVFYAPWCGHCKRIKPEFEKAAARINIENIPGLLAAVDATVESGLAARFGVKGYPTLKYFNKGQYKYDAGHARQEEQIVDFIKNPQEPPPPPPPEKPWSEEEGQVRHLSESTFKNTLRKVKHAIIMFYAPWCGHCKSTKPEFSEAAETFADELSVVFGAVDCTTEQQLCSNYKVRGYPTLKYFSYFNKLVEEYSGGRKKEDFITFINSQRGKHEAPQKQMTSQEAGFGVNVQMINDDDFHTIIASKTPTFIMFYATWCGHCSTVKPVYSRLATKMKSIGGPVLVAAVEASDNPKVADYAKIETLPTFKIYSNGNLLADYDGDRSAEDFERFCMSHAKRKDEL